MSSTAGAALTKKCPGCLGEVSATATYCHRCGTDLRGGGPGVPVVPGYTIERKLGEGGAATVYLAKQDALDRHVAIKVLRQGLDDPKLWSRFQREAHTIARLSLHPNVVTVHTAGRTQIGQPYLVTEFLDRGSLSQVLAAEGPLPPATVAHIGIAVADALAAAHEHGILHRDVKPGNVLLDHGGRVKLGDFGIARLLGGHVTTTDVVAFTPEHVAPEVLRGDGDGPMSDVYGLASTLVTALTGHAPLARRPGERLDVYLSRKVLSAPPALPPTVPPRLNDVVTAALDPDPGRRPSLAGIRAELAAVAAAPGAPAPTRVLPPPATLAATRPQPVDDGAPAKWHAPADGGEPADEGEPADWDAPEVWDGTLHDAPGSHRRRWLAIAALVLALVGSAAAVAALIDRGGDGNASPSTTQAVGGDAALVPAGELSASPTTVGELSATPTTIVSPGLAPVVPTTAAAAAAAPVPTSPPQVTVAPTEVVLFTTTSAPLPAAPTAASLLAAADEIGESVSEQEAATFIRTYYDAVSRGEYDTTWGLLSPEFQRGMARSYDYYSDFWNENDAEVGGVEVIQADEDGAVVAVELYWNGSDQAESHQFTLRRGGSGELLIVGQD